MNKKLTIFIVLVLLLTVGCSVKKLDNSLILSHSLIETKTPKARLLEGNTILFIEVLDELNKENSVIKKNGQGLLEDFYSLRKVKVLEQINGNKLINENIYLTESVAIDTNNKYESYEDGYKNQLKKGYVYTVVVEEMDFLGENIYGIRGAGQEKEITDYIYGETKINYIKFLLKNFYDKASEKQLDSIKYEGIINYVPTSKQVDDDFFSHTYNDDDDKTYIIINNAEWYSVKGKLN